MLLPILIYTNKHSNNIIAIRIDRFHIEMIQYKARDTRAFLL